MPEGMEVDETSQTQFLSILSDDKMSPKDRAQALVDLQGGLMTKAAESVAKAYSDLQEKWQNEVKADPELGGQAMQANLAQVSKMIDAYAGSDAEKAKVRAALDATGAGNHPDVIRFMFRLAKVVNEPGAVHGAPTVTEPSRAEKLYPSMQSKG